MLLLVQVKTHNTHTHTHISQDHGKLQGFSWSRSCTRGQYFQQHAFYGACHMWSFLGYHISDFLGDMLTLAPKHRVSASLQRARSPQFKSSCASFFEATPRIVQGFCLVASHLMIDSKTKWFPFCQRHSGPLLGASLALRNGMTLNIPTGGFLQAVRSKPVFRGQEYVKCGFLV